MDNQQNPQDNFLTKVNKTIDYDRIWRRVATGLAGLVVLIFGIAKFSLVFIIGGVILAIAGLGGAWQLWKKV